MTSSPPTILVQPYLFFEGRCEEALEFYRTTLGARIGMVMRYKDAPENSGMCGAGLEDKIMHASFEIGGSTVMASDGRCLGVPDFKGFSLSLDLPDAATAERAFQGLLEGGEAIMPLGPTFFAKQFGMVTDRFGVGWMVIVPA